MVSWTEIVSDLEAGTAVESGPAEAAFWRMSAVSLDHLKEICLRVRAERVHEYRLYACHISSFVHLSLPHDG